MPPILKSASTRRRIHSREQSLAWIAERRDMTKSIPALATYRETRPCTPKNCSADDLHTMVASSDHNTWGVHR